MRQTLTQAVLLLAVLGHVTSGLDIRALCSDESETVTAEVCDGLRAALRELDRRKLVDGNTV